MEIYKNSFLAMIFISVLLGLMDFNDIVTLCILYIFGKDEILVKL